MDNTSVRMFSWTLPQADSLFLVITHTTEKLDGKYWSCFYPLQLVLVRNHLCILSLLHNDRTGVNNFKTSRKTKKYISIVKFLLTCKYILILRNQSSQFARGVSPFILQSLSWQLKEKIMQFSRKICRAWSFSERRLFFRRN